MPNYAEWIDHFSRIPAPKRRKLKNALDNLLSDSWMAEHYGSEFRALKAAIREV